jgi:hypothetical protein
MTASGNVATHHKPKIKWKEEFSVYFEGAGLRQKQTKTLSRFKLGVF